MAGFSGFMNLIKKKVEKKKQQKAESEGAVPSWIEKLEGPEKERALKAHKLSKALEKKKKN